MLTREAETFVRSAGGDAKLRILYVVHGYKPAYKVGGPITSVAAVAEGLVARGHEVTVLTTNWNLDETLDVEPNRPHRVDGVEVWYFECEEPLRKWLPFVPYVAKANPFLYSPQMRNYLGGHARGFDLLHAHIPFVYPSYAASVAAERHHRPFFYHQRGVFDPERLRFRSLKKNLYISLVERGVMRRATTLFALTQAEVASYRALGVDNPTVVIPNGIDATHFGDSANAAELLRLGISDEDLVVLFMARIHPVKGVQRLLDAFLRIARDFPRAILVLAGPDEFGLRAGLEQQVAAAGLGDRVRFPGMLSGALKTGLLSRANLFALPSDAEGFSIAVLEAMASRTAVLLSPGCHFPEVTQHGVGVIVDNDPVLIGNALAGMLRDPRQLAAMGEAARSLVEREYSWGRIVERIEYTYRDGIGRFMSEVSRVGASSTASLPGRH